MKTALITGGAGFFGELLKNALLQQGYFCVSIDLEHDSSTHPNLASVQGDIRDENTLVRVFSAHRFDVIFHCAAILAHAINNKDTLWTCNVDGTRNIAEFAKRYRVPKVIYLSSNCLWGENLKREVNEEEVPRPVEIYGRSKWEAEKTLGEYTGHFTCIIFRCPTIIDLGRLGLLSILFEFVAEGRKIWVIGAGDNRYQFVYAQDLIDACIRAIDHPESDVFNIGSDNVMPMREIYDYVIRRADTGSRVASFPKKLARILMKLAYLLKVSPLGPYQHRMLGEDFIFDTSKIKNSLGWRPTLTNEEMLFKAYEYYLMNLVSIRNRTNVSAHKQPVKMGVIKLLKWLS